MWKKTKGSFLGGISLCVVLVALLVLVGGDVLVELRSREKEAAWVGIGYDKGVKGRLKVNWVSGWLCECKKR